MSIEQTLEERGSRYGAFEEHARIAQAIQSAYRVYPEKWDRLPPVLKQGFTVIADKIARALNGDPLYSDNLHDIVGYGKLMEDWVKKQSDNCDTRKAILELTEELKSFEKVKKSKEDIIFNELV